jgi:uncharacterized protein (DUF1684 family)
MNLPEFDLLDWKRRVFDLYRDVRNQKSPEKAWELWRVTRDELFRSHPQSPIPEQERRTYPGVPYFDYDPSFRVLASLERAEPQQYDIPTSGPETMSFTRFARARFKIAREAELELYWLTAYGGGIFLAFRDATSTSETYGAGRYLLDTVKGADLGSEGDRLVLDFNFAYNPSCAYDPKWVCPLAPPLNRLDIEIRAGEKIPDASEEGREDPPHTRNELDQP